MTSLPCLRAVPGQSGSLPSVLVACFVVLAVVFGGSDADAQTTHRIQAPGSLNTVHLQFINLSAGSELFDADFYGDSSLLAAGLARYAATPFYTLVTGERYRLSITPPSGDTLTDIIWSDSIDAVDQSFVTMALVGNAGANPGHNPDGIDVSPRATLFPDAAVDVPSTGVIKVNVLHAAGDASWLGLGASSDASIVSLTDSVAFGSFADYVEVPVSETAGEVYFYVSENGPALTCGGDAIYAYHACYRVPADSLLSHGNVFTLVVPEWDISSSAVTRLLAVFTNGVVVPIPIHATLGVEDESGVARRSIALYPTPATQSVTAEIESASAGSATARIIDLYGRVVATLRVGSVPVGESVPIRVDTSFLASGVYSLEILVAGPTASTSHRGTIVIAR
ncbi:MAG: hypothetical protein KDD65_14415 [Bacteroidetes bacterium]|nr:hypothetical protein [Bacteroidota bacterium]